MANVRNDQRLSRRRLIGTTAKAGAAGAAFAYAGARLARPAGAQDTLRIAFSVPGLNFPFFVHMMDQAEAAAAEIGGIEFIRLDGQNDALVQSAGLENLITQGADGLVISPSDANAMLPAIEAVLEAGIPVVTVDRNVAAGTATLAHVGADNVEGGRVQGRYILELFPDGGRIFELLGQTGATPAIDRDAGLKEALEGSNIEIVFEQTANFSTAEAVTVTENGLTANGAPDAIVCANDDMALGVVEVLQAQGLSLPVIGFDALPTALQAIQAGTMAATIEQFPGEQASTGLQIIVDFIRNGTEPAEHDVYLTPTLITADNLAEAERAVEAGVVAAATPEATPAS